MRGIHRSLVIEFLAHRASSAENVSIWWRHHDRNSQCYGLRWIDWHSWGQLAGVVCLATPAQHEWSQQLHARPLAASQSAPRVLYQSCSTNHSNPSGRAPALTLTDLIQRHKAGLKPLQRKLYEWPISILPWKWSHIYNCDQQRQWIAILKRRYIWQRHCDDESVLSFKQHQNSWSVWHHNS